VTASGAALVVVYDASVLHPAPLRDLLIRVAAAGLVRARWTDEILDECFRSILERGPDLRPQRLARTRALMIDAVPDCLISGHDALIPDLDLPDPDDRHVLAAAMHGGAEAIITANLADFPPAALEPFGIRAQGPDSFVRDLIELDADLVVQVIREQAADLQDPPRSAHDVVDALEAAGLGDVTEELRTLLGREPDDKER
jgi:hypothetical protein